MALSESRITELYNKWKREPNTGWRDFALAIESEVRKQDEALIRQLVEALEVTASDVCQAAHHKKRDRHGNGDACPVQARHNEAITAGRARLEGKP